jgi:hypothetical protein
MADDLSADFDHLFPQGRRSPVSDAFRQRRLPEEVPEVANQGEQLLPYLVVDEVMAGESRPFHCILGLFDHLFSNGN